MTEPGKRLTILTRSEIRELYGLPQFSFEDRVKYFSLDPLEKKELEKLRTIPSGVYFIVQLGYLKAKKMFFTFEFHEIKDDVLYIVERYFSQEEEFPKEIPKATREGLQETILTLLCYRSCTQEVKTALQEKANYLATICAKPIYIFKELLNYLEHHRCIVPGYSTMQTIVSNALMHERTRLENAILQNVPHEYRTYLEKLLSAEDSLHEITLLKKEPRDFSHKEITREVAKGDSVREIYTLALRFLPTLGISNENIKYYASLVGYYTVYKLKRMSRMSIYIYLLCFIFNRYQKINDNLVNTFIYYVRKYAEEAKKISKALVYEYKMEGNKHMRSAGKVLALFIDDSISEEIEFGKVKQIAFDIIARDQLSLLSRYISGTGFDDAEYEWNQYARMERKFKINLRYIFLHINFEFSNLKDPFVKAVSFLKEALRQNKSLTQYSSIELPCDFIPSKLKGYLYEAETVTIDGKTWKRKRLDVDKYEFLIYRLLKDRLEAGDVFVSESLSFKTLEADLIEDEKWKRKEELIQSINLPSLTAPITDTLASFSRELEDKLYEVNDRMKEGKNPHVKITGKGNRVKWSLSPEKSREPANNPIYAQLPQVGIGNVLYFVNEQTDFMASFSHILERYVKNTADDRRISASLVAYGTNIGLGKMAGISDMSYNELVDAARNFIRLETLKAANDKISNAMGKLPVFKCYHIKEEVIHSSSDGQKYETHFETINSRYSPKYFGLNKGITSYTLVANHIPINAKIIGANEHESHYVFDILFNNTTEIEPSIHSTDSHGINQVNFIILHLFGYMFAPRYKDIDSKVKTIYSFEALGKYKDLLVKPSRKINTRLIEDEWENIQKILVSLALKTTTQNTIIRKLSSYERKNKTQKALWELDNIVSSLHTLRYIDSPEMRRNIQKAINRGESYNKLRRASFHDNFGKFRVKTEMEQHVWSECTRLIVNSIIFYNAFVLSRLLEQREKMKRYEDVELIKRISPIAWRHINLYGRFEFKLKGMSINIDEIIGTLGEESIRHQLSEEDLD